MVAPVGADLADCAGSTREALAIASWLGAGVLAWYGFGYARELARQTIETAWLADAAALCVVFIVPLIGFKLLAAMITDRLPGGRIGMRRPDAGMAFGAARGAVIVCAAYLGLTMALRAGRAARPGSGTRSSCPTSRRAPGSCGASCPHLAEQSRGAAEAARARRDPGRPAARSAMELTAE